MEKKLLYLSTYTIDNRRAFSGSNRRMFLAFQKVDGYKVEYKTIRPNPIIRFAFRALGWLYRKLFRRDFQTGLDERLAPSVCRRAASFLRKHHYDGVICWQLIFGNLFKTYSGKRIFFSDATYHKEVFYYRWKVDANQFARNDRLQAELLTHADLIMLSNHYFDNDLLEHYHLSFERVRYFHFFPTLPSNCHKPKMTGKELKMIIVAQNYHDKGVPIAIQTVEMLNNLGIAASLTVVGFEDFENLQNPFVHFAGYVPQEGERNLGYYLSSANLFILPTHHDCSPLVIPEANSFSLPVIAYSTGGIPDYIIDGVNGYLIPEGAPAEAFVDAVRRHLNIHGSFTAMGKNAKNFQSKKMSEARFLEAAAKYLDELFVS